MTKSTKLAIGKYAFITKKAHAKKVRAKGKKEARAFH